MHYGLFADVLDQLAASAAQIPGDSIARDHLRRAANAMQKAIEEA
jgi:hypothetical protein